MDGIAVLKGHMLTIALTREIFQNTSRYILVGYTKYPPTVKLTEEIDSEVFRRSSPHLALVSNELGSLKQARSIPSKMS